MAPAAYDYASAARITGDFQPLPDGPYKVQFRRLLKNENFGSQLWTRLVAYGALLFCLGMFVFMFMPEHWTATQTDISPTQKVLSWIMLGALAVIELCRLTSIVSASWATLKAMDPVPVVPPTGLRIAFATTCAPGEPVDMVRTTLKAMQAVAYKGTVDVWLLDETGNPALQKICHKLSVHYFTRKGVGAWNTLSGKFAHKTKHGNFNAWLAHCARQGIAYDVLAGVDTDHVPRPEFLDRLVCYLRDPNVAFAVGPQVYGNYGDGFLQRAAEAQASFFQGVTQRAGNRHRTPMFVGTNYTIRWNVLHQIDGFQACITEDMATGLKIHATRNPATKKRWRSVYTPDVLAVGEGPQSWADYNTQQMRWAEGAADTWRHMSWRLLPKLGFSWSLPHYVLLMACYPAIALNWILGTLSGFLYLVLGASAVVIPVSHWSTLYACTVVLQISLYVWNRQRNVSPHEPKDSLGINGMLLSAVTIPVYALALVNGLRGKKGGSFNVTAKGGEARRDSLRAFRLHITWAIFLTACIVFGVIAGNTYPAIVVWIGIGVLFNLLPLAHSRFTARSTTPHTKSGEVHEEATELATATT